MQTIEQLKQLALRIYDANPAGALHIVTEDGNMLNEHIFLCMKDQSATEDELSLCHDLLAIPLWLRVAAWESGSYLQYKDQ